MRAGFGYIEAVPESGPAGTGPGERERRHASPGLGPGLEGAFKDLRENFQPILESALSRLDLVTRDEFEVQKAVLARTREKVDRLESLVADLEKTRKG